VPLRAASRRALAALPGFAIGVVVFAIFWWAADRAADWSGVKAGEIDAWLMMRLGSPNTAWAHRAILMALVVFRDILGVSVAVALAVFVGAHGLRELARARWLRAAVSRRQLATIALAGILLIALPWRAVDWRPASLPASGAQIAFAVAKLSIIYLLMTTGWAYILRAGVESLVRADAH
jgi:hypothetical protein